MKKNLINTVVYFIMLWIIGWCCNWNAYNVVLSYM